MTAGIIFVAFLAGLLSVLSPCVLPLLPIVFGAAASRSRAGPVALALGVALSYVIIGLFLATLGFELGLDGAWLRRAIALAMILVGLVLALPALQYRVAAAGGPISDWANAKLSAISAQGLGAQFIIGALLGAAWSPCVGPTLGAASLLAARGDSLGQVALTMSAFGIGAALPLALIGGLSRVALARWRTRIATGGAGARIILGALMLGLGVIMIADLDRQFEAVLVAASPEWLTRLTTAF